MAERDVPIQLQTTTTTGRSGMTTTSFIYATIAGIAISGPLLCITGIIFFVTSAFLMLISPLLIIFSPLLFLAGVVLTLSMMGFAAAVGMAVAGISAIGWTMRTVNKGGKVSGFLGDPVKGVVDTGRDWAGYLQSKVGQDQDSLSYETRVNRG